MKTCLTNRTRVAAALTLLAGAAAAQPVRYDLDPSHTFPSFEADHMGLSVWRGKFNQTRGHLMLDKAAGQGSVVLTVDIASIDYGNEPMNKVARGKELFDAAKYPKAQYKGQLAAFVDGAPTRVEGELTLHGVTRPVALKINSFKCLPHPMLKGRDWCGADAEATINRADFGIDAGRDYGFKMDVLLRIQAEAVQAQ